MSNQNQKVNEQKVEQVQQVETPVQAAAEPQVVQQPVAQVQQETGGFKAWMKRHWKGAVGGALGLGTAVGSAWVAYKKGKAAGINSVPMPTEQEDYSLNPNE